MIKQFEKTGEYVATYGSLADAARAIFPDFAKHVPANISRAVKRNIIAYGYRWSYE